MKYPAHQQYFCFWQTKTKEKTPSFTISRASHIKQTPHERKEEKRSKKNETIIAEEKSLGLGLLHKPHLGRQPEKSQIRKKKSQTRKLGKKGSNRLLTIDFEIREKELRTRNKPSWQDLAKRKQAFLCDPTSEHFQFSFSLAWQLLRGSSSSGVIFDSFSLTERRNRNCLFSNCQKRTFFSIPCYSG